MVRRLLVVTGLVAVLVVGTAAPAFAHATLVATNPAPGQVLAKAPPAIVLRFNERVDASFGAVRVYNTKEERVDAGGLDVSGSQIRLPVPELKDGSYVVTWRVTSSDSHPVEGAFTFQIGNAGNATSRAVTGLAQRLLSSTKGDQAVGIAYGVARWGVFTALALLLGAIAFAMLVWPEGRAARGTRRLVWGGWIGLFAATVVALLLYGPYAAGLGLGDSFQQSLIGDTLGSRFGIIGYARLGLLLLAVPVIRALLARDADGQPRALPSWWLPVAAPLAVAIAATPGLAGHASVGDWRTVAVITDTAHVLGMAIWLGGIVALALVLLPGRTADELHHALPRWSRVALGCITAIIATGAFQTWRQVGGLDALRSTDYGRILIVKLVFFSVILVLAAFSREIVLRLYPPPELPAGRVPVIAGGSDDDRHSGGDDDEIDEVAEVRRLRRSVWAEVVVAVALLAVTALLVNAAPAKSVYAGNTGGAVGVTLKAGTVWVDISLTPGTSGRNDVHVSSINPNGTPLDVQDLTITFALPDRKIAPIKVPLRKLSPGHYLSPGFDVPFGGDWRVVAKPLLSDFDEVTIAGTVSID